jgi:hypothetical protein
LSYHKGECQDSELVEVWGFEVQQLPLDKNKIRTFIEKCRHFNVFPLFFSQYYPQREPHPVSEMLAELVEECVEYLQIMTDEEVDRVVDDLPPGIKMFIERRTVAGNSRAWLERVALYYLVAVCQEQYFTIKAKRAAAASFFSHTSLHPAEVRPADVERWRTHLEERGFKPATVYAKISRLSSFYEWVMKEPTLGQYITSNPARLAMPKCPKPYQTESTKALDDEQMTALIRVVRRKAEAGETTGKRDYALLLFFITTGMRRREVIGLRGQT